MADDRFTYKSVTQSDMEIYNKHKSSIESEVRKSFPSIPATFELKPVRVRHVRACGTIHEFKIALPDDKFVKISFLTGANYMRPPDQKDWKPPEPHIKVTETVTLTADE